MLISNAHVALGARLGPVPGGEAPLDYAPLERELPHIERAALCDWGFHSVLTVHSAGARKLLQNILTSDLGSLRKGTSQSSLLLTPKGKMVGLLRLLDHGDGHLDMIAEAPCAPGLRQALGRYAAVAKVPLEDRSAELGLLLVTGSDAPAAITEALECEAPKPGTVSETPAGNVVCATGLASPPGFLLMVRREQAREAWDRLLQACRARGGGPVGWHAVEAARVRAAVPRFGSEISEETLPGEAGLDAAISFTKGCFVGQEVVARIKNLGHVNRLTVLLAPSAAVQVGDAILAADRDVGRVTSVAPGPGGPAALAVVRREHAEPGTALQVGNVPARVVRLAQLP